MSSILSSPVGLSQLISYEQAVQNSANSLFRALAAANVGLTVDLMNSIKAFRSYSDKFKSLVEGGFESEVNVDDAVREAAGVAIWGNDIAGKLKEAVSKDDEKMQIIDDLESSSNDLNRYCQSHLSVLSSEFLANSVGTPAVARKSSSSEDDRFQRLNAKAEDLQRSFVAVEAKLKAISDAADQSVVRIEQLTNQQADMMRATLSVEVADIINGFSDTKNSLANRLGEFDEYRDQAKELLGQLAIEVLAKGHLGSAQTEEKKADAFRSYALLTMVCALLAILAIVIITRGQEFTWAALANRAVVSLLFAVPIAYLARESAKHRSQAVELRRLSLDFAALEPFLKGLDGENGQVVRAELARRAFFTGIVPDSSSSLTLDPQAIIIKGFDTIAEVAKKK